MKRTIGMALALICLLGVAACAAQTPWGITMLAEDVSPTGMTLVIRQKGWTGIGELSTGTPYWIERLTDGQWKELEKIEIEDGTQRAWTTVLLLLKKGEDNRYELTWELLYGTLPAGQYRLGKAISLGDEKQTFYAEFEIQ